MAALSLSVLHMVHCIYIATNRSIQTWSGSSTKIKGRYAGEIIRSYSNNKIYFVSTQRVIPIYVDGLHEKNVSIFEEIHDLLILGNGELHTTFCDHCCVESQPNYINSSIRIHRYAENTKTQLNTEGVPTMHMTCKKYNSPQTLSLWHAVHVSLLLTWLLYQCVLQRTGQWVKHAWTSGVADHTHC